MIQKIKNCFTKEEVNTGRQLEFDIAKAIAIIVMIISHVMYHSELLNEALLDTDTASAFFYYVLAGIYCAPIFMTCMGIGVSYSRKNSANDCLKRGLTILVVSVILEVFRTLLPSLVDLYTIEGFSFKETLISMSEVDILYFAGLSFLLTGLLKKAKLKNIQIFLVSILLCSIATILREPAITNGFFARFCDFFIYVDYGSAFPLFVWFVFPSFGMVLGDLWKKCKDKKTFFTILSPICFILPTIYVCVGFAYNFGPGYNDARFYGMYVWDTLISIVLSIGLFGICYLLGSLFKKSEWRLAGFLSKNINSIYCIHWVILAWLIRIPFMVDVFLSLNIFTFILFGILTTIVSGLIVVLYHYIKRKIKNKKKLESCPQ